MDCVWRPVENVMERMTVETTVMSTVLLVPLQVVKTCYHNTHISFSLRSGREAEWSNQQFRKNIINCRVIISELNFVHVELAQHIAL